MKQKVLRGRKQKKLEEARRIQVKRHGWYDFERFGRIWRVGSIHLIRETNNQRFEEGGSNDDSRVWRTDCCIDVLRGVCYIISMLLQLQCNLLILIILWSWMRREYFAIVVSGWRDSSNNRAYTERGSTQCGLMCRRWAKSEAVAYHFRSTCNLK